MSDIIETNPQILGGKPVIKGTILTLLKIGKDANENLMNVDLDDIISKEV